MASADWIKIKPRINLLVLTDGLKGWQCRHGQYPNLGAVGYGKSPSDAYKQYEANRKRLLAELNSLNFQG